MKDSTFYVFAIGGAVLLFKVIVGPMDSSPTSTNSASATSSSSSNPIVKKTQSKADYKVVEVVTTCDIAAKRMVKNPSSFSSAWSWEEVPTSRGVTIYRNFTAMNGFGANLDSYYVCSYDAISKKFVAFDIRDGNY